MTPETFIDYWRDKGGLERATYQKFINELCDLIGVARPEAQYDDDRRNDYVFERRVKALDVDGGDWHNNYIDCYKRDCFVLEAKQSSKRQRGNAPAAADLFGLPAASAPTTTMGWDRLMRQARNQAERYAKALPQDHGWPPFLVIVDVGNVIELHADFTGLGKAYLPFPDSRSHRIRLDDLADPQKRDVLRLVWTRPKDLDPAAKRAEVTRDIARRLARVAESLEKRHAPKTVALFLMRCLFTAFAEDVELLPPDSFLRILQLAEPNPQYLPHYLDVLWRSMDKGGFDPFVGATVRHFNGGLFRDAKALAVEPEELCELIAAARRDWRNVEPAIFGTLLENALTAQERGQLGAHFTPRAYVDRLVVPAVMEPLLEDWAATQALIEAARAKGDSAGAVTAVQDYHRRLCGIRVLDPACGTGNFLYVALDLMKRLEAEVLRALEELGGLDQYNLSMEGHTVNPRQFLGLEKNPRAVPVAELVLWLGYLQWQKRVHQDIGDPVLRSYDNICEQDAILAWSQEVMVRDEDGRPVTRWDGVTLKADPVTGRMVPDETKRVEVTRYLDPKRASWPKADFIVGNPPFVAGKDFRQEFGDGYAEALWAAYPDIPGGADFVMYWWDKAAALVREGKVRRFGFITTNSITQTFSRRVIQKHLDAKVPLHLAFAVPDHPWADGAGTAAVRIALTVGAPGVGDGVLKTVRSEAATPDRDGAVPVELTLESGKIHADLSIGADVASAKPLKANEGISSPGVKLHGSGFIVTEAEARALGLGSVPGVEKHIRDYRNGRDLTGKPRNVKVIDMYGLSEAEVRREYPQIYQRLIDRVKPERTNNNRESYKNIWWVFGEPRSELRDFLSGLPRYIATVETAKHRIFQFLDKNILPDNRIVVFGLSDGYSLGVLSSKIHGQWALSAGGLLEDRPVYSKTTCFDPFPFPAASVSQRAAIGALAEELDAHRKRVLAEHGDRLTLTLLYNVLEKRRNNDAMTPAERDVYDLGQVGVMLDVHRQIDRAVADAYGWPVDLAEGEVLARLVALNAERRQEEAAGTVRWLRPDYQNPTGMRPETQMTADLAVAAATPGKIPWPKEPGEQVRVLVAHLRTLPHGEGADALARRFRGARTQRVRELLDVLVSIGHARQIDSDRFAL